MIEKHPDFIKVDGNDSLFPNKFGFKKINFDDLLKLYEEDNYIPYGQYLRTNLWKTKRLEITDRDSFKCRICGGYETTLRKASVQTNLGVVENVKLEWSDTLTIIWTDMNGNEKVSTLKKPEGVPDKPYNIQVHHKKYILNRLPWEYDNEDLITLCNYCHTKEHEQNDIPIYNEQGQITSNYLFCDKCGGTGYLPQYKHVAGGVCFKCKGARFSIPLINRKL